MTLRVLVGVVDRIALIGISELNALGLLLFDDFGFGTGCGLLQLPSVLLGFVECFNGLAGLFLGFLVVALCFFQIGVSLFFSVPGLVHLVAVCARLVVVFVALSGIVPGFLALFEHLLVFFVTFVHLALGRCAQKRDGQ